MHGPTGFGAQQPNGGPQLPPLNMNGPPPRPGQSTLTPITERSVMSRDNTIDGHSSGVYDINSPTSMTDRDDLPRAIASMLSGGETVDSSLPGAGAPQPLPPGTGAPSLDMPSGFGQGFDLNSLGRQSGETPRAPLSPTYSPGASSNPSTSNANTQAVVNNQPQVINTPAKVEQSPAYEPQPPLPTILSESTSPVSQLSQHQQWTSRTPGSTNQPLNTTSPEAYSPRLGQQTQVPSLHPSSPSATSQNRTTTPSTVGEVQAPLPSPQNKFDVPVSPTRLAGTGSPLVQIVPQPSLVSSPLTKPSTLPSLNTMELSNRGALGQSSDRDAPNKPPVREVERSEERYQVNQYSEQRNLPPAIGNSPPRPTYSGYSQPPPGPSSSYNSPPGPGPGHLDIKPLASRRVSDPPNSPYSASSYPAGAEMQAPDLYEPQPQQSRASHGVLSANFQVGISRIYYMTLFAQ